jgi:phosphate transport system permease protein
VRRRGGAAARLWAQGEPILWLTWGALAACLVMILGLLGYVVIRGVQTFWPLSVVKIETLDGRVYMGEVTREETYRPDQGVFDALPEEAASRRRRQVKAREGWERRRLVRIGNYELTGEHFAWVGDSEILEQGESRPRWAVVFERLAWGRFYGEPKAFLSNEETVAGDPQEIWTLFQDHHPLVRARRSEILHLERQGIGEVNYRMEQARLRLKTVQMNHAEDAIETREARKAFAKIESELGKEFDRIRHEIRRLEEENDRYRILVAAADGKEKAIRLADVVRAYPANQISWAGKFQVYLDRWAEFLSDDPREANSEGGVFPAIFGTVVMTLLMSLAVMPFGVLAALYLREYAKGGPVVSAVRVAINNLAGVPSIVFGVFGLGFFSYIVGARIDEFLFSAKLPSPTFGTGGILWASLTLALLTLPVVIVSTEEALAAVPNSTREGSYACGASKWQTIRRVVLPRAMPGVMTGMILAMARGAGEVAPLMLVGAVKLAPELPIDVHFPFVHLERSFMHLGFHIYDLGFQSQNSEASKPMVITTTLLLITIIFLLNLAAVSLRSRLRGRFSGPAF